ncbi:MAG TPA: 50S ribosomal protein L4 [Acidimicrobiales bacterium]
MPTIDVRTRDGATLGSVELDEGLFGIQPHVPVLHQVVTAQLAAARRGTQSTKTRAEVSGGGAKPFRQKGTGRARQGSTRAPHWSGGGIALGPKPRSYKQRTPKKMIRLALASALSDRAAEGRIVVLDGWGLTEPRTKDATELLATLQVTGRVMVVVAPDDEVAIKSFRNLPDVQLVTNNELNAYDVLCNDWVLFTRDVVPGATGDLDPASAKAAPAKPKPAPVQKPPPRRRRAAVVEEPAEEEGPEDGSDEVAEDAEAAVPEADTDSSGAAVPAEVADEAHDAAPAEIAGEAHDAAPAEGADETNPETGPEGEKS